MDSQLKPSGMSILQRVLKSGSAKILWDFSVQIDQKFKHRKPDTITDGKEAKECYIINVPCSSDTLAKDKKRDKVERLQKLKRDR